MDEACAAQAIFAAPSKAEVARSNGHMGSLKERTIQLAIYYDRNTNIRSGKNLVK
jgi:hypothetical protein